VAALDSVTADFAARLAQQVAVDENIVSILSNSPQTIVQPVSYTIDNLLPFHQPVYVSYFSNTGFPTLVDP
jgi:hypothetical protein